MLFSNQYLFVICLGHSVIIDTTNNEDNWLVTHAMLMNEKFEAVYGRENSSLMEV